MGEPDPHQQQQHKSQSAPLAVGYPLSTFTQISPTCPLPSACSGHLHFFPINPRHPSSLQVLNSILAKRLQSVPVITN